MVATGSHVGGHCDRGAPIVASNADARVTFTRLVEARALPPDFLAAVERISYDRASL